MYKGINIILYCTIEEESGSEYVPSDVEYDEGYDDDDNVAVAEEEETDDAAVEDMDIVNPFDFGMYYTHDCNNTCE